MTNGRLMTCLMGMDGLLNGPTRAQAQGPKRSKGSGGHCPQSLCLWQLTFVVRKSTQWPQRLQTTTKIRKTGRQRGKTTTRRHQTARRDTKRPQDSKRLFVVVFCLFQSEGARSRVAFNMFAPRGPLSRNMSMLMGHFANSRSPLRCSNTSLRHWFRLSSFKAAICWSKEVLQSFISFCWKTSKLNMTDCCAVSLWGCGILLADRKWRLQHLVLLGCILQWHARVQANRLCEYDAILQLTWLRACTEATMQLLARYKK